MAPARIKMMAFALSGFLALFAGGVLVLHQQALGSDIFAPIESIRVLTMVVVGGLGSIVGSVLGATFLQSTEWFSDVVPERFRFFFESAGSGIGLIVVLMLLPGGLGSLVYKARDSWLRVVARRHELVVPSLIADTGTPALLGGANRPSTAAVAPGADDRNGPRFLSASRRRTFLMSTTSPTRT